MSQVEAIESKEPKKHSLISVIAVSLLVIGLTISGVSIFNIWQKSKIIIPETIKKQVSYLIYWPSKTAPAKNDKSTIKYDPTNKFLSYISTTDDGVKLTISEQPTPDSFVDIPKVYDSFIEQLQQYSAFETANGKVFLVHPKELKGGQTAIMNSKGTLMFIKPDKDLNDDTWRKIFNNLQIIH